MSYHHTQRGPLNRVVLLVAGLQLAAAWAVRGQSPAVAWTLALAGLLVAFLGFSFASLTVRDAGDHLRIAFGPLPLLQKRLVYADIRSAQRARSRFIDGWGVHYFPGRGWTWNLWGRDCVELETRRGKLRIGTDDAAGLERHLHGRVQA